LPPVSTIVSVLVSLTSVAKYNAPSVVLSVASKILQKIEAYSVPTLKSPVASPVSSSPVNETLPIKSLSTAAELLCKTTNGLVDPAVEPVPSTISCGVTVPLSAKAPSAEDTICSVPSGEVVPIPTLPVSNIVILGERVEVVLAVVQNCKSPP